MVSEYHPIRREPSGRNASSGGAGALLPASPQLSPQFYPGWPFETWPDPRIFPNTGAMIDDRSEPGAWRDDIPYLKGNP